jgi:hypothetical protein
MKDEKAPEARRTRALLQILSRTRSRVDRLFSAAATGTARVRTKNIARSNRAHVETLKAFYTKVVIWGHKPFTHTHSFIHSSYYRAFRRLGFDTYWFDDTDDVSAFDFRNCIFLTEDQAQSKIPLEKTSFYVLHHCALPKYIDAGCRYLNLCNYVNDCTLGKSFNYPGGSVERITYYSYFDQNNLALYQPWGTDLLPEEILDEPRRFVRSLKNVFYIGSITSDNREMVDVFSQACRENGKNFVVKKSVTDRKARMLVRKSFIAPDIRCQHHVNVGYVPCRIFKNISYGVIPATNSVFCRDFLGDMLPYAESCYDLYAANVDYLVNAGNLEKSRRLMAEVRENHTYLTRIDSLLSLIRQL